MSNALSVIGGIGGTILGGPVGGAIGTGLGSLFGGSSGGTNSITGGSSTNSQQSSQQVSQSQQGSAPVNLTLPWFSQLGQNVAGGLGNFLSGGTTGAANPYSGPLTGQMSGSEWDALSRLQQATFDPARQNLLNATLTGQYLPGQNQANPFLNAAITAAQRPTAEALQNAVGRQIPGMFAAAGQQVGQRVGGGGSTAKDLNLIRASEVGGRALGDIASSMSNTNYQFERGLQQGAIGLGQQDIGAMIANLQAQGLPRTIEDQGIQRAIALGQQGVTNWLQGLQIAGGFPLQATGNVSSGTSSAMGTSQGTSSGSSSPGLGQSLFGNQGLLPGLNSIFAPTTLAGGQTVPNPTIYNTGFNPFSGLFG